MRKIRNISAKDKRINDEIDTIRTTLYSLMRNHLWELDRVFLEVLKGCIDDFDIDKLRNADAPGCIFCIENLNKSKQLKDLEPKITDLVNNYNSISFKISQSFIRTIKDIRKDEDLSKIEEIINEFREQIPESMSQYFEYSIDKDWQATGRDIKCKEPILQLVAQLKKVLSGFEDDTINDVIEDTEDLVGESDKKQEPSDEDNTLESSDSETIKRLRSELETKDTKAQRKDEEAQGVIIEQDDEIKSLKEEMNSLKMFQEESSNLFDEDLDDNIILSGNVLAEDGV